MDELEEMETSRPDRRLFYEVQYQIMWQQYLKNKEQQKTQS